MKKLYLFAEIGSTTTYLTLIEHDLNNNNVEILGQTLSETTVQLNDISIGLINALNKLKANITNLKWDEFCACSSAGGGLRITVHGLMKEMTVKAAIESALGAGAILKMITAGFLRDYDISILKEINPNLIIISGGTDYGERKTTLYNINKLVKNKVHSPIIYCGNVENQKEVSFILNKQEHYIVENVYPTIDELNIAPLRKQIQSVFENNIIYNKGFDKIKNIINGTILPTPGAVFYAAELLYELIGDLLVIDVGGATTDIHSVCKEAPEHRELLVSPEPIAKRTVDGDLGVYINREYVLKYFDNFNYDNSYIDFQSPFASADGEKKKIITLALKATEIALARHAGFLKETYNGYGGKTISGKDLTKVKSIVLTGGALTQITDVSSEIYLLIKQLAQKTPDLLLPQNIEKIYIDKYYIMALCGYLSINNKEIAKSMLKKYILPNYELPKTSNKQRKT